LIDKKTRITLRSIASTIKSTVWIGKDGVTPNLLNQLEEELFNHELVKITVQESITLTEDEVTELAVKLGAEVVTVIGRKIVLYKHSEKKNIKHVLN